MTEEIAKSLAKVLEEKGGFTAFPGTGSLISVGYAVSRPGTQTVALLNNLPAPISEIIKWYAQQHEEKLSSTSAFLGGWINGEELVLDITDVFFDRDDAINAARANNQKAIFNFNKAHVEWVSYPEDCM